jgi:hypothetical protein
MLSDLSLKYPPGFILLCLAAGVGYAWLVYQKQGPWSVSMNRILFAVRALVVSVLAFLLLSPVLRQVQNFTEKPTVVIAVDNSTSVPAVYDSLQLQELNARINELYEGLGEEDYDVEIRVLEGEWEGVYTSEQTNLDRLLQNISNDYEGRNLQEVVLVSDGIYNEGISPTYREYPFSVSAVGIGDSTVKKDIYITNLLYNKIAYQGNKFPLMATLSHHGFAGENVTISVLHQGKVISRQNERLPEDGIPLDVNFLVDANEIGYQQYSVTVNLMENEFLAENNIRAAFVEIVEGKQTIHIVAAAPHPDLKAIKSALETSQNYELKQYILSIPEERQAYLDASNDADLVILHQIPSYSVSGINWAARLKGKSQLYVFGPSMNLNEFSSLQPWISIRQMIGEYDRTMGVMNTKFSPFTYSDELMAMLSNFPPLVTPFGDMSMDAGVETILFQQIGSITTSRPLLAIKSDDDTKAGLLLGSGIWQWKLTDYAENKDNRIFNELITKLVQFLSTRDDKNRFRLYPIQSEYQLGEDVVFETEVYNELYERIYGNRITLELVNPAGEVSTYSYVTSETNSRYRISGLEEGIYRYNGTTEIDGKEERVTGQVVVQSIDLEMVNLTANFGILQSLARGSGGEFYSQNEWENILETFRTKEARGIIYSEENYLPVIDLLWVFLILLGLITLEWGLRKYHGSY